MVSKRSKPKARKKIPEAITAQILIQSKRRCCLCFHFHNDLNVKKGQIAHINKKRDDNSEDNLAFLCFQHHDEYDSTRSQSKGITSMEVKHAKKSLSNEMSAEIKHDPIKITISIDRDFNKFDLEQRKSLLDKLLSEAQVENDVKIHNIEPGSIKYTIEVKSDDALLIIEAFNQNKLSDIGVKNIKITDDNNKANIDLGKHFKLISHGVTRKQAIDTIFNPDSYFKLDDLKTNLLKPSRVEIYLKKVSYKHSLLIIADRLKEDKVLVITVLPFSHNEVVFERGDSPWDVLNLFVIKYGIDLEVGLERKLLWRRETINVPLNVDNDTKLSEYLDKSVKNPVPGGHELICIKESKTIISSKINIILLFAISKNKYKSSLKRIGLKYKIRNPDGDGGSIITIKGND